MDVGGLDSRRDRVLPHAFFRGFTDDLFETSSGLSDKYGSPLFRTPDEVVVE